MQQADDLAELAKEFEVVQFEDEKVLMQEGEPGKNFYILLNGTVDILVTEKEVKVATRQRGDNFGEVSLLTGAPVSATIKSVGSSELLMLDRTRFEAMVRKYPDLNNYFHSPAIRNIWLIYKRPS